MNMLSGDSAPQQLHVLPQPSDIIDSPLVNYNQDIERYNLHNKRFVRLEKEGGLNKRPERTNWG